MKSWRRDLMALVKGWASIFASFYEHRSLYTDDVRRDTCQAWEDDARAIGSDWKAVGNDLRDAIGIYDKERSHE